MKREEGKEKLERRYSAKRQRAINNRREPRLPEADEKYARIIFCGLDC
jgi:hypothetical protein